MDLESIINRMEYQAEIIRSLTQGMSEVAARWRPEPDTWSILEVINHLYDEEREDFRARLDVTLHHPDQPWPKIDPGGWVKVRDYNQRGLEASINGFLYERKMSLNWLGGLESPDWDYVYQAPFGPIRAGDILNAWTAHDLLHTRQLVELHWAFGRQSARPFNVEYAGDW